MALKTDVVTRNVQAKENDVSHSITYCHLSHDENSSVSIEVFQVFAKNFRHTIFTISIVNIKWKNDASTMKYTQRNSDLDNFYIVDFPLIEICIDINRKMNTPIRMLLEVVTWWPMHSWFVQVTAVPKLTKFWSLFIEKLRISPTSPQIFCTCNTSWQIPGKILCMKFCLSSLDIF